jgi:hypothetical protein
LHERIEKKEKAAFMNEDDQVRGEKTDNKNKKKAG